MAAEVVWALVLVKSHILGSTGMHYLLKQELFLVHIFMQYRSLITDQCMAGVLQK